MSKPLASMTGFGRASGTAEDTTITCEIKAVNGRGLDIRTRLSPGFDALDAPIRRHLSHRLARGSLSVYVNIQRHLAGTELVVNKAALDQILALVADLEDKVDARKPSLETILGLKGVLDIAEAELGPDAEQRLHMAVLDCIDVATAALVDARRSEGSHIGRLIAERIDEIADLAHKARHHPARSRETILARLNEQLAALSDLDKGLDPDRLHQEALLLANKADITEELDRFDAHVAAARALLDQGGPVGRKLDFLSQEFNREANTLCSKSNDVGLTAIGLDLKAAIDQLREQVQNLE